jgi:hypothetical protein
MPAQIVNGAARPAQSALSPRPYRRNKIYPSLQTSKGISDLKTVAFQLNKDQSY